MGRVQDVGGRLKSDSIPTQFLEVGQPLERARPPTNWADICRTSLIWTHTDCRFHFKLHQVYSVCVTHQSNESKKRKDTVGSTVRYEVINYEVIPVGT